MLCAVKISFLFDVFPADADGQHSMAIRIHAMCDHIFAGYVNKSVFLQQARTFRHSDNTLINGLQSQNIGKVLAFLSHSSLVFVLGILLPATWCSGARTWAMVKKCGSCSSTANEKRAKTTRFLGYQDLHDKNIDLCAVGPFEFKLCIGNTYSRALR